MDRTEAVEVLTKMLDCEDIDFCDSDCFKCRLFTKAVDRSNALIMAIKALGKDIDVPSKWIPLEEKMPDTNVDVLLQFKSNMGVGFYEDGDWAINTGDGIYSLIGYGEEKPIAWMPLPDPWEGE